MLIPLSLTRSEKAADLALKLHCEVVTPTKWQRFVEWVLYPNCLVVHLRRKPK